MEGSKIVSMVVENLQFLDSLNYLPMRLKNMPISFDHSCKKGYYRHIFTTAKISITLALIPNPSSMEQNLCLVMNYIFGLVWGEKGKIFNNREKLSAYCMDDVNVLRQACSAFGNLFFKSVKMDTFWQAFKISFICNKVFRTVFLKRDSVAIIPWAGYRTWNR